MDDIHMAASYQLDWSRLRGKSIFVAGATGLIGRCLVDILMYKNKYDDLDCHIYAAGRNEAKARLCFSDEYFHDANFTFMEYDVKTRLEYEKLHNVDYVLHLASNTHPIAYAREPIDTILTNILGLNNLLELSLYCGAKRFVFPSSVEIYGENKGDVEKFDEYYMGYINSNTLRAGYPESKRCGETLCQAYIKERGLDIVIPRLPRIYGATMQEGDSKAVAQFIKKAVNGEDIVLKSDGSQYYSFLYVVDAVIGVLAVMLKGANGEAYNIADEGNDITLRDAATALADIAGVKVVFEIPDAVEKAGYSTATKAVLDGGKVRGLGWKPMYTIKDGLRQTVLIMKAGISMDAML
jgi:nucleoside-diphosphate-sugar epimerase